MKTQNGILLVNLGTPDSPKTNDVYRYLIQFLTDERVIDVPWLKRQCLVRGLIVPMRVKNSASSYKEIWEETGSPLLHYGRRVESALQKKLGEDTKVVLAMRYQNPSIEKGLAKLRDCSTLIVLPLFPQYASASTGSVHQEVMRIVSRWQVIPNIKLINSYPANEKMVETYALNAERYALEDYDHFLFSFHGLPERHLKKADRHGVCLKVPNCCETMTEKNASCYGAQCFATAQAIQERLSIPNHKMTVCFQSRLGKDPWVQPFTSDVLKQLAEKGIKKVLVFCPSFVADCLETIFEISVEYREEFTELGGETLDLVESLNDHPLWVEALSDLVHREVSREPIAAAHV